MTTMSFDAAFVSCLREISEVQQHPLLSEPVLKIHSVRTFENEDTATSALRSEVLGMFKELQGDHFIGEIEDEKKMTTQKVGTYAVVSGDGHMTLWYMGETISRGWVTNATVPTPFNLGTISVVPVGSVFDDTKNLLRSAERRNELLELHVAESSAENNKLRAELAAAEALRVEAEKNSIVRALRCNRLVAELEKVRQSNCKAHEMLMALNNEITELRKKITNKDREMSSLREDAQYAVRAQLTPRTPIEENSAQSDLANCFNSLQSFDRSKLRTRQERDALIAKKLHRDYRDEATNVSLRE